MRKPIVLAVFLLMAISVGCGTEYTTPTPLPREYRNACGAAEGLQNLVDNRLFDELDRRGDILMSGVRSSGDWWLDEQAEVISNAMVQYAVTGDPEWYREIQIELRVYVLRCEEKGY